ncbi:MAG: hypothetical protein QOJ65_2389 [Fimbriimonadaceae bacterium]|nr:hypothetical protein [Fimbriimonadaceae bacterium]
MYGVSVESRTRALGALVALAFISLAGQARAQGFRIDRWDEKITLRPDAVLHVEERIAVTFTEAKRGIFRVIPVRYSTGRGTMRSIYLKGTKVFDDNGHPQTAVETREGNNIKVRVGDANVVLPAGTHKTYVIRYLVTNALNWFDEPKWVPSAEMYWNVTGNEWPVNVRDVNVELAFPKVSNPKDVRLKIFTGALGSRNSHLVTGATRSSSNHDTGTTVKLTTSSATITRKEPLPTGHGLTLVLNVPTTVVPKKAIVEEKQGNSTDYAGGGSFDYSTDYARYTSSDIFGPPATPVETAMGLAVPVAILILMGLAWFVFGRDPNPGPLVVQYDPPDDLGGPQCGAMIDEHVDERDFSAGFVSLAVKGYIRIKPLVEGLIFQSRSAEIEVLQPPGDDLSSFETTLLNRISAGGKKVSDLDLRENVAPFVPILTEKLYGELVGRNYYSDSPANSRASWTFFSIVLAVGLGVALYSQVPGSFPSLVVGVPVGIVIGYMISGAMPKRTKLGSQVLQKIKGFEEFIRRARSEELNWMTEKHPDQALFEKYLPHAVAFGLAKEWADAFKGVLQQVPDWYVADAVSGFDAVWFATELVQVSNSVSHFAMTPPRTESSSNSGGGFWSGGGFSSGSSGFSSGFSSGSSSHSGGGGGGYSGGGAGGGGGGSW